MTIEEMKLVDELTAAIEEGLQGDGTHVGLTDSELILKALRRLKATANLLVVPTLISFEKSA